MEGMGHPHQVRANQAQYDNSGTQQAQPGPTQTNRQNSNTKWYQPTWESKLIVSLVMVAALIVLVSFFAGIFTKGNGIGGFVDDSKYQAVFLSNGQVYFGKITRLNQQTMVLEDIYYLQVDQQLQPEQEETEAEPQVSLVKLGEELHGPEDRMFIYTSEIVFWENLRKDGQVSQAIESNKQGDNDDAVTPEANDDDA